MDYSALAKKFLFHGSPRPIEGSVIRPGSFYSDFDYARNWGWGKAREMRTYDNRTYAVPREELKPTKAEEWDVFGQSEIDVGSSIRSELEHKGIEIPKHITSTEALVDFMSKKYPHLLTGAVGLTAAQAMDMQGLEEPWLDPISMFTAGATGGAGYLGRMAQALADPVVNYFTRPNSGR